MLLGRDRESARAEESLDRACSGSGEILLLRGDPGIGKSVLLGWAVERAAERMLVLQARGFETEAEIGYSVLADLCRPLGAEIAELPELLREALQTAIGAAAGSGEGSSTFAVGRALTVLLQNVAAHQPVLISLDDGHWADEASAYALAFAARRLGDSATTVLITLRNGEPSVFDGLDAPSIELSPLDRAAAEVLIGAEAARRVGPRMAEHIHRAAQGNPLALLELADAALSGRLDPDDGQVVPSGPRLEHAFATRLKRLPERCTRALMVVATSYTGGLAEIAGAMARLGLSAFDLDLARMERLVWEDGDRWQMRHPVFRSVAYQNYPLAERRQAHQAFADWLADNGGGVGGTFLADQRAWHAAAAALPGDEDAAGLLAEAADAARSRGALVAARRAYLRTRELSAKPEIRALMSIGAAECAQVSGDVESAQILAREALQYSHSPAVANSANRVLHQITLARAGAQEVLELFEADADEVAAHDPDLAASYLGAAAATAITATRLHDTLRLSAKGVALTPACTGTGAAAARTINAFGLVSNGHAPESARVMADYFPAFREADPWRQSFETVGVTGMVLIWLGMTGKAGEYISRTARLLRQAGAEEHLPLLLIPQVLLSIRKGEFTAAHEAVEESRRLGGELGQRQVAPLAVALAARLAALRGNFTRARDLATTTEQLTEATGATFYRDIANTAVGSADLAQARHRDAVSVLAGVRERALAGGMVEHSLFMPTFGDYIEALIRLGDGVRARAEVAEELPRAETGGLPATLAVVYRCQAQVLPPDEAVPWFERALAAHADSVDAFEQARTHLAYGRFLREDGKPDPAGRLLSAAAAAFTTMGADPWLEEAETELDLLVLPADLSGARLATQERRVMRLAAEGATNSQISEALGIAPRAVDDYLEQVLHKLGVNQRSQLARLLQKGAGR
ncbi:DNA-binding CsgD family transcriptional regulator [Catenulispora sp. MAP5-51]|uniref:ATP-binding protein n=1 Tax=Catenulispora sp. MAP5-51 TaxID=3156298 RepID=UPI0035143BA6